MWKRPPEPEAWVFLLAQVAAVVVAAEVVVQEVAPAPVPEALPVQAVEVQEGALLLPPVRVGEEGPFQQAAHILARVGLEAERAQVLLLEQCNCLILIELRRRAP